jgi:hypothetical protein
MIRKGLDKITVRGGSLPTHEFMERKSKRIYLLDT